SSTNDSVVVLSQGGAEKLLGNGDMLVLSPQVSKQGTTRVQGAYVDNSEIKKVVDFLKENYPCEFDPRFVDLKEKSQLNTDQMKEVSYDKAASDEEKYKQIREDVMRRDYCSLSYVQRTYGVGFPRAGKIIVRLMNDGVLSEEDEGNKGKKVLLHNITPEERTGSVEQSTFTPDKKE
ncbi:MAG: DNA translocase FtsK, partial [Bacilli bacterium]